MTEGNASGLTMKEKVERAGGGGVVEEKINGGFLQLGDNINSDNTRKELERPAALQQKHIGNNLDDKGIFVEVMDVESHWMDCISYDMSPYLFTGSSGSTDAASSVSPQSQSHSHNVWPSTSALCKTTDSGQALGGSVIDGDIPGVLAAAKVLVNLPENIERNRCVKANDGSTGICGTNNTIDPKDVMNGNGTTEKSIISTTDAASSVDASNGKATEKIKEAKKHLCILCGREFQRRSKLKRHEKTHTGDKPFKCSVTGCCKCYGRKEHLTRHWQQTHNPNRKQRACPYDGCYKNYSNVESYSRHVKTHDVENGLFRNVVVVEGGGDDHPSQKSSTELSGTPPQKEEKEELGSTAMELGGVQPALGTEVNTPSGRTVPDTKKVSDSELIFNGDKQQQQLLRLKFLVAQDVPDKARSIYDHLKHGKDYRLNCQRGETPQAMDTLINSVDKMCDQRQCMVPPNSSVSLLPNGFTTASNSRHDAFGLNRTSAHMKRAAVCHEL